MPKELRKPERNKPDAVNPAMALWLTIEDQWRRVSDLERWAVTTCNDIRFNPQVWPRVVGSAAKTSSRGLDG